MLPVAVSLSSVFMRPVAVVRLAKPRNESLRNKCFRAHDNAVDVVPVVLGAKMLPAVAVAKTNGIRLDL